MMQICVMNKFMDLRCTTMGAAIQYTDKLEAQLRVAVRVFFMGET